MQDTSIVLPCFKASKKANNHQNLAKAAKFKKKYKTLLYNSPLFFSAKLHNLVSSVSLSLSHWYPGSGVVLDCIDS